MKTLSCKVSITLAMFLSMFLSSATPSLGQTIPNVPCLEHFTSSTCPPCASFNPVLKQTLSGFEGRYTVINYQMYWPSTGDPYYFAESKKRRDYYTITGVPGLTCNGVKQMPYAQTFSVAQMEGLLTLLTGMTVGITASVNLDKIVTATITITPEIGYEAGLVTQIVVMEKLTTQNFSTNGERFFDHVTMGFMPNANGTVLGALSPGQAVTLTYSMDMKNTFNETANDLMVAAFVQNNSTKEILQSKMAAVTHPFADYPVNLSVIDNDYNPVLGGNVFMPYYGNVEVQPDGLAQYPAVFPGTHSYEAVASGYIGTEGEITVGSSPFSGDIVVEKPDLFFFQDFNNNEIPAGWRTVTSNGFMIYGSGSGSLVFYKTAPGDVDSYLILPPVNLTQTGIFSFRAGNQSGNPMAKVGIVTTGSQPGTDGTAGLTVTSFTELFSTTVTKFLGFSIFGFPLPETIGNQLLAIKLSGGSDSWFELDQVAIIEDNPGVKVQFLVTDQNDIPLKNTNVTLQGKTVLNNAHGYSTFRDTDPGNYPYIITYKNHQIETGILPVIGEMVKHIRYNTSSIEDPAEISFISIYPNPVNDHFVINGIHTADIAILNLSGQVLLDKKVLNGETILTGGLNNGLYLLRIQSDGTTAYRKILISR